MTWEIRKQICYKPLKKIKFYSDRVVEWVTAARKLYHIIGTPSLEDFKGIIQSNMIQNNPVTVSDVKAVQKIYGPNISSIKGKTTWPPVHKVVDSQIEIPKQLIEANKNVILCMDIIHVQGLRFLTTISIDLKFRTIEYLEDWKIKTIYLGLDSVLRVYNKAGFEVKEIRADPEFIPLEEEVMDEMNIQLNPATAQEHVPRLNNLTVWLKNDSKHY